MIASAPATFEAFIAERIAKPLKLADTGFWVEPAGHARIAEAQVDKATGQRPALRDVKSRPRWFSGGGGLVSTALDYSRFCQLLLNGDTAQEEARIRHIWLSA